MDDHTFVDALPLAVQIRERQSIELLNLCLRKRMSDEFNSHLIKRFRTTLTLASIRTKRVCAACVLMVEHGYRELQRGVLSVEVATEYVRK